MVERIDLFHLPFYKKEVFTGSDRGFVLDRQGRDSGRGRRGPCGDSASCDCLAGTVRTETYRG